MSRPSWITRVYPLTEDFKGRMDPNYVTPPKGVPATAGRRRPLRCRIWFYRPRWYFHRWSPVWLGSDEFDWHTVVIGWAVTGQVVLATRRCPATGKCAGLAGDLEPDWTPARWTVVAMGEGK